jgi:dimeric dUTPase (all-alpha-NTP-PPase superfamily)
MMTIQSVADLPAGAVRSRSIIPAEHIQHDAEAIFITAGEIEQEVQANGQLQLFTDLLSIAVDKGFQDTDILRSLIQHRVQTALMHELVCEVIEIMGGPGDFFDAIDLITWPDEGCMQ